jgi:membrane protein DedA with SNARE-associated domain
MIGYVIGHWIGLRLLVRYGKYIRLDEPQDRYLCQMLS